MYVRRPRATVGCTCTPPRVRRCGALRCGPTSVRSRGPHCADSGIARRRVRRRVVPPTLRLRRAYQTVRAAATRRTGDAAGRPLATADRAQGLVAAERHFEAAGYWVAPMGATGEHPASAVNVSPGAPLPPAGGLFWNPAQRMTLLRPWSSPHPWLIPVACSLRPVRLMATPVEIYTVV